MSLWEQKIQALEWGIQIAPVAEQLMQSIGLWTQEEQGKCFEALVLSVEAHDGQMRKSGEPYVIHPIAVAQKAFELGLDADSLCAALLHDVVEDTDIKLEDLEKVFGASIASMVNALTKIDGLKVVNEVSKENSAQVATFRKMLLAMSQDMRVMVIKLCDRWHNMKTIEYLPRTKQLRMIQETKEIYAPLASRLGMNAFWAELKEMCFVAQYPLRAKVIKKALDIDRGNQKDLIEASIKKIKERLDEESIEASITGRHKSVSSIYEKMCEKKLLLKEVLDREGVRVIVKQNKECYWTIGILHSLWKPIPGMFKDYIALPKLNGYQSLHTAVLTESGTPLEIQVRTQTQHLHAEEGIAAHWHYKVKGEPKEVTQGWAWLQSLLDIQASTAHSDDFLEHVRTDLFSEEVYVFSPKGEVIALPKGACVLDYAFSIHSDIGLRVNQCRINGIECELSSRLKNGDKIQIDTGQQITVRPVWLSWVRTGKAKAHIRAFLKTNTSNEAQYLALELISNALIDLGVERVREDEVVWQKTVKSFGCTEQELYLKVVLGKVAALSVAQKIAKNSAKKGQTYQKKPIFISGEDGEHVKMSTCCVPLPPMSVEGILTPDKGLVVHKKGCKHLDVGSGKWPRVEVQWEPTALSNSFSVHLKIKARNERGALAKIAAIIATQNADINNVRIVGNSAQEGRAVINFDLQVCSKFHLDQVVLKLKEEQNTLEIEL